MTTQPTCTAKGVKTYTCTRCSTTKTEDVAALGHDYNAVVTAPTCTAAGYTTHTCSRCGNSYTDSATAALGHSWNSGSVTTQPTCTAKGVKTYTCSRCSTTKTEDVAALGHSYNDVVTAPTCTAAGYTTHTCSRCGNSYTDSATAALGHSFNGETGICTRCNYSHVIYTSNGNGTCSVTGLNSTSETRIVIAGTSPAGDTVTTIAANAFGGSSVQEVVIPTSVTTIAANAFNGANSLTKVFYAGTEFGWEAISISSTGNAKLTGASRYYYSASEPAVTNVAWHWVNGVPTIWVVADDWGPLIPLN